jgi:hypothetical protein
MTEGAPAIWTPLTARLLLASEADDPSLAGYARVGLPA